MSGMDINIHLSLSFRLQLQATTIKPPNRFTSNYIAQGTIRPSLVYIHIVNDLCIIALVFKNFRGLIPGHSALFGALRLSIFWTSMCGIPNC